MFVPIEPGIAKTVAKGGTIEFVPFEGWAEYAVEGSYFMSIPHSIIYHVEFNKANKLHWFICKLSVMNRTMMVNDIELSPTSLLSAKDKEVRKPLVHMALGIVTDASMEFALKRKRSKIIVGSALPGIADVLFERNFTIKTRDLFDKSGAERGFRGLKRLQEVC